MTRPPSHLQPLLARCRLRLIALLIFPLVLRIAGGEAFASEISASSARPNIAPREINLSAYSARPGDQIAIAWTTTNSGSGLCPPSFTGIHLGQFATMRPASDNLNLLFVTPEVGPGSSVRQTNLITIPFNTAVGTYYLWVVSDDVDNSTLNQTTRADDAARSSAFAVVTVTRQPNLIPQNVTLNAISARPGDPIEVAWTLANSANVTCPKSITGFHLGASSTVPPASDVLDLRLETPEINAGATIRFTNLVTIPTNTTLGTYYFWVVADDVPVSTLNQSSRADDAARSAAFSVVSVITRPNLVPQDVKVSASQVRPGGQLTVMWSVANSGNANCPDSVTGLHLGTSASNPPAFDGLNVKVATPAIATGSFVRQTNAVTIPANTPLGTYYLWVVVDDIANSRLDQSSRADDAARSDFLAVVSVIRQPNLTPTNVVLNAQFARPSDPVTATWTLRNTGNTNCPPSHTGLRLGASATVRPTNNLLNISILTPAINAGGTLHQTNIVTIPEDAPLGTNYLWVIADDVENSTLDQSSRADDAAVSGPLAVVTVLPRPNLVPLNVTLSTNFSRPGSQVTVSWTMTNSGNGNCPASFTGLHLGPSADAKPTNDVLNLSIQTAAINAGAALRQTNVVTIPTNTTTGTYYLWVVADDVTNSTLNQSSRADDAAPSAALAIARVTLISPAGTAMVDAPPTFEWNPHGTANAKVYLAAKANPVLGTDKVVFFDNPGTTNRFKPAATNWAAAVTNLGFAQNYFWTAGNGDPARREIFAEWRPFRTVPMPVSRTLVAGSNGQFQFQIAAPNQTQVVVEASENLASDWVQIGTIPNVNGTVTYTDLDAGGRSKRYFRARP